MTWSYNPLLASTLDQVRFKIGDTDTNDQLLSDEEINALLTACSDSVLCAAYRAARGLAAKFSRYVDQKVDRITVNLKDKAKAFTELADELYNDLALQGADVYAGGLSQAEKQADAEDENLVQPRFRRDMDADYLEITDWVLKSGT